jgi:hypothetical protein
MLNVVKDSLDRRDREGATVIAAEASDSEAEEPGVLAGPCLQ